ncbi:hypothetical protein B0A67_01660 [Flavobacterium aquidurense]|jgi:hypothetical protein|uniref:hypothetical protein n=1 Tax=Flavobacterium aquidurense TaxID=362413 RepID=UPI00091225A0|nr:hypothetical protein [Flavobacterium aquidurense]OXA74076.1 hypothetical protein B0A67_01660 [Flavobacterium aquidurense]SHG55799.1 hypothetical protein SAMN05444481_105127 [Flavobacterium frigidimaris]
MKLKNPATLFSYLKQLLLVVALVYAFSNCHVKKSVLHFAGIGVVEISQKSLTSLPVQGSCTANILHKNTSFKKSFSIPQVPIVPGLAMFHFQVQKNSVTAKLQIHPAFEFEKSSINYPALFIVFKNLKIAPRVVSHLA